MISFVYAKYVLYHTWSDLNARFIKLAMKWKGKITIQAKWQTNNYIIRNDQFIFAIASTIPNDVPFTHFIEQAKTPRHLRRRTD